MIPDFRAATRWDGLLFMDPSLASHAAAGLARSLAAAIHPRGAVRVIRALALGFGGGAIRGSTLQQGGTFVIGPGDVVHFEWRDRFTGDMAPISRIVAAIRS